jgi:hypothetical protein
MGKMLIRFVEERGGRQVAYRWLSPAARWVKMAPAEARKMLANGEAEEIRTEPQPAATVPE